MAVPTSVRLKCIPVALLFLVLVAVVVTMLLKSGGSRPNVVIIVMDTVRQDHLSCYGYERPTTPNLDKLVTESRTFLNAYSTSGWTPPAHASLFTGLYSIAHGATQENPVLQLRKTTIAEILGADGYHTVGISENPMLTRTRGFAQGFAEYHETWKLPAAEENHAVSLVSQSLAGRDPEQPFFMFVNFIEPHSPYDSSRQFFSRFLSDTSLEHVNNQWPRYLLGEIDFTPDDIDHLRQLYDAEILYVDFLIGQMIDTLKQRGLWDDTVFIVTSDHGENFEDHQLMDHVFSLHQTTIHVPLIVRYPSEFNRGTREEMPVQLTDLFPTILDLVGIDPVQHPNHGVDLRQVDPARPRVILSEYYFPRQALNLFTEDQLASERLEPYKRALASVILADHKYIWGGDGRDELYNLSNDPAETRNLIADPALSSIKQNLINVMDKTFKAYAQSSAADSSDTHQKLDEATEKALKSLGYIR